MFLVLQSCEKVEQHPPLLHNNELEFQTYDEIVTANVELRNDTAVIARFAANKVLGQFLEIDKDGLPILNISFEEAQNWESPENGIIKRQKKSRKFGLSSQQ